MQLTQEGEVLRMNYIEDLIAALSDISRTNSLEEAANRFINFVNWLELVTVFRYDAYMKSVGLFF